MTAGRIVSRSRCFDGLERVIKELPLPADFLPPDQAKGIYGRVYSRLQSSEGYCWEKFERHGLSPEEGTRTAQEWPGQLVYAMFLDKTDERVLRIEKSWIPAFVEEYLNPMEETYLVSQDLRRAVCFDHHERCHSASIRE